MSLEKVKEYFKAYGIEDKIIELSESSATVELAAHALNTKPCRIAKTLSFMLNDSPILVVTAGDVKIDNAKYRHTFGAKAKMLTADQAEELIGHAVGGVCPFGLNDGVTVYLDESLKQYETVFPACGSSNSAIELTIPELEKYSGYEKWVDVTKAVS
ncbi:MAG: YbaK/EbsC family protein [Ruminiclostridium sp.]